VARARGATVVHEPVANRSRARNAGVAATRAPRIAFTDGDCLPDPRWLEALLGCADRAPLVAGDVRTTTRPGPNAIERFEVLWRFGQEHWVRAGWAATANLLVAREAFDAVGGFDPTWRHIGEDADFCLRARAAGHGIAYCAEAVVAHEAEHALRPFLARAFRHGYSVHQAHRRHGLGERADRHPGRALRGDAALRQMGARPDSFAPEEWRRMARVARLAYAGRVAGSAWARVTRVS
jgi:GT2 family glycosyltransferase